MEKKKIVAYIRVGLCGDSNIAVEHYKTLFASRNDCELANIYLDKGGSGRDKQRLMFQKMIEDGKAGKFDFIVCKNLAKFSRDPQQAFYIIEELKKSGVGVYFETENINTLDENYGVYAEVMKAAAIHGKELSAMERKMVAENPEWLEPTEPDELQQSEDEQHGEIIGW